MPHIATAMLWDLTWKANGPLSTFTNTLRYQTKQGLALGLRSEKPAADPGREQLCISRQGSLMVSWADRGRERVPPQYAIPRGVLSHEVGIFLALREMVTEGWELSCLLSTREVSV